MRVRRQVAAPPRGALAFALSAAFGGACGGAPAEPQAQWVVRIETDAPVPALGDRLLIELLDAQGRSLCTACRRVFEIEGTASLPLTFGIAPPAEGSPPMVRARLFRTRNTADDGQPSAALTLDALGRLPPARGITRVTLPLFAACAGVPADVGAATTCDATSGARRPAGELSDGRYADTGSWSLGRDLPCPEATPAGMVCVPGGLFAQGETKGHPSLVRLRGEVGITPERLVRLSSFAMDETEVTVGTMRGLVRAKLVDAPGTGPGCSYAELGDDYPVTCVTHDQAKAACAARGLRLPTEAEWEFVAGNRARETPFPWGHDLAVCGRAVVARGVFPESRDCVVRDGVVLPSRPEPVGTSRDETLDPAVSGMSSRVRDLAGNVREWTLDAAGSYAGACRTVDHVQRDPLCTSDAPTAARVVRGASFSDSPVFAYAHQRVGVEPAFSSKDLGFRCVRSYGGAPGR